MATTNHERVGKALELLKAGLGPFVDREVQTAVKAQRLDAATLRRFVDNPLIGDKPATRLGRRPALQADVGDVERRVPRGPRAGRAQPRS